ncbi:MFS transporter [Sulfodiicoccus acidiphilus]|uniref:MFS transporter n=1 Tax=Sulfodiicoccus acidiphilus TaxID=1670455 RepID=A0A348B6P1_9CREN|nr:MFS transporter [Sulfodiicoccus acidiphilus]BBD73843.1 MFS transporter [Sulfodiicoccus acidiphilus]GGT96373.1 MFS transporter [Sulfodiicoccus acidiphilus]
MSSKSPHATTTLAVLAGMLIIINYVETMVVPALPKIESDFNTTATTAAWITSAYLIVGAVVSPLFGKMGDRFGKKRMYLVSVGFYILAVGLAGLSPTIYFLIGARAIQGLGYAMFPIAISIVTDVFPREEIATAQGILSGAIGIGPALGLLVGAYVVQDLGWQWAFHTAFLLSLALFLVSAKMLKESGTRTKESVDYVGASLLMASMASLLVYLSDGPSVGWAVPSQLALLTLSLVTFGIFLPYEKRAKEPLMRLDLLKVRNVMVANVAGLISGVSMFLMFLGLTYYEQLPPPYGLGLDIVSSGLLMAPVSLTMIVMGPLVGRMVSNVGPKPVLTAGTLFGMLGFFLFIVNRATSLDIVLDSIMSALGLIFVIVPLVNMVATSLPPDVMTTGLGMNTLIRTLGSSAGPVVATVLMDSYQDPYVLMLGGKVVGVSFFPSPTAFNYIFVVGLVSMFMVLIVNIWTKNYTFSSRASKEIKETERAVIAH